MLAEEDASRCDTDASKSANRQTAACECRGRPGIVSGRMPAPPKTPGGLSRRMVVVAVPPVDELDLVGPLQVFNSVNRLAGRPIYAIEVVTNADRLTIDGKGGVLTFIAKQHFSKTEGAFDSGLLVCR